MSSPSKQRCIIDFLSGTWSPQALARLTGLAKSGAKLKSVPSYLTKAMKRWYGFHEANGGRYASALSSKGSAVVPELIHVGCKEYHEFTADLYQQFSVMLESCSDSTRFGVSGELRRLMSESLLEDEFIAEGGDFSSSYRDLVASYGVQWLDALCCSELDYFVYMLNAQLSGHPSISGPHYGRWSVRVKNGGMFGYSHSADLLCDGECAGVAAWGAANHGCLISFTGVGCAALDMSALHKTLSRLPGFKLTRLDIALDDFKGQSITIDAAREWAQNGKFTKRRPPSYCYIESGQMVSSALARSLGRKHDFDPCKGRSFYVGSRASGLMVRFYEKGKQATSDKHPDWVRAEVEMRNIDRVIPLDAMVNPDKYFAGAYPCLSDLLSSVIPEPVPTTKGKYFSETFQAWVAKGDASRAAAVKAASIQCGRMINYLTGVECLTPAEVVLLLTDHLEPDDLPQRLKAPAPSELFDNSRLLEYGGMVTI